MAYKKEELIKEALKVIKKNKCIYIEEVVAFMECSKKTFYLHKLHELPTIKEAIVQNKHTIKASLRKKMHDSRSAADHIALYKLLGTRVEREALGVQITTKEQQPITTGELDLDSLSLEEQIKLAELLSKAGGNNKADEDGQRPSTGGAT